MTVPSNAAQIHNQLLRHGMLSWVLRGMYLGYQRNYLELQVDDLFLGDDAWQPTTNVTNYDPSRASRMTPADLAQAIAWSKSPACGSTWSSTAAAPRSTCRTIRPRRATRCSTRQGGAGQEGVRLDQPHLEHPNLDCSTAPYITRQIADNIAFANANGLPLDSATELVTGEHSGLANTCRATRARSTRRSSRTPTHPAAGAAWRELRVGRHGRSAAGETPASIYVAGLPVTAGNSATIHFDVVCGATSYRVYRRARRAAPGARSARWPPRPTRRRTTARRRRADVHRHGRGRAPPRRRRWATRRRSPPTARTRPSPGSGRRRHQVDGHGRVEAVSRPAPRTRSV